MNSEITRREPVNGTHPIDRLFHSVFARDPFFSGLVQVGPIEEGSLALDVSEDETSVIVRASLPGYTKDNIAVEVAEGVLTITARRSEQHEERGERFYRKERREGSVSRRIALPTLVDEDNASADLADGVLTLRLPKAEKARRRQIAIN